MVAEQQSKALGGKGEEREEEDGVGAGRFRQVVTPLVVPLTFK